MINILVAILSTLFGFLVLPSIVEIVEFIILNRKFGARRASYITKSEEKKQRKKFEKSAAYSTRLEEILKLIKEESASNYSIEISYLDNCETEQAIKRELERRHFNCQHWERNTLKISW